MKGTLNCSKPHFIFTSKKNLSNMFRFKDQKKVTINLTSNIQNLNFLMFHFINLDAKYELLKSFHSQLPLIKTTTFKNDGFRKEK